MYYYDVVASICTETHRIDSVLICGGFETEQDALRYIDEHGVSESGFYNLCNEDQTAYIEIEAHDDESGTIVEVIAVD